MPYIDENRLSDEQKPSWRCSKFSGSTGQPPAAVSALVHREQGSIASDLLC
jgi:hypothetical protein